MTRANARVLLVGVGGLGSPAALILARAGVGTIGLCDDDEVEQTNLHRQVLFADADVGAPKIEAAARALRRDAPGLTLRLHRQRLLPDSAAALIGEYDLVLEGADNFATKFLTADACLLAATPVVHASAVRWVGTALAVSPSGRPCYRCLFEDIPADGAPGCSEAGVMGPVVGLIAAVQADLALGVLDGSPRYGEIVTFDGQSDLLRRRPVRGRSDCALCGERPRIVSIESPAYAAPASTG